MSAGPVGTLARWTDEEHEILVKLTNDQIELESQDHTQEISWAAHWRKVSSQLHDHGYNRTNTACQSYWKRVVETQKANEEAAGPRWDDSEHQILLGMTEDQLALEKADPTAVVPWPRHWKTVSLRLQQNGYSRTPNACAAYWLKVGYDFSVDFEPGHEMPKIPKADGGVKPSESSIDDSVSSGSKEGDQEEQLQPDGPQEPKNFLLSNAVSDFTPTITPVPSEKDASEDEYHPLRQEPSKSKLSQTPVKAESPPQPKSSGNPRGFRFNAEQRAYLETEAATNGAYPDSDKRVQLAHDLGVEEKTIRNWFVHRRSQKGQNVVSSYQSPASSINESFVSENSTPTLGIKRRPFTVDCKESSLSIDEDTIGVQAHPSKRIRLKPDYARHFPEEDQVTGAHSSPYSITRNVIPIREDVSEEIRQSANTSTSPDISQDSSMAGSVVSRGTAATSISSQSNGPSSFSAINRQTIQAADFALQILEQSGNQSSTDHSEIQHLIPKMSPTIPAPVSGAAWNPVNSSKGRDSRPTSLSSTPTPDVVNSQNKPSQTNNPVSATPPPKPTPQQASPGFPSEPASGGSEKDLFIRKAVSFQAQIENLNREQAARFQTISQINRHIDHMVTEEKGLEDERDALILKTVKEIEERYKDKQEHLKAQLDSVHQSKEAELEAVRRNNLELKKKTKALGHVEALVAMYDEDDDGEVLGSGF